MFTVRNVGGAALFLFGTTFLWLTPAFATRGIPTGGFLWALTRFLALATVAGFTLSTWGLFRQASWWEGLAVGSAALGVVVLVPYWIAAARSAKRRRLSTSSSMHSEVRGSSPCSWFPSCSTGSSRTSRGREGRVPDTVEEASCDRRARPLP